jgi:YYY domain-containing protein
MSWLEASLRWYGVLIAITWPLAPLAFWLGNRLPDRGAAIARPLAMLVAVFPAWFLASTGGIAFGAPAVWATILVIGAAAWGWLLWRGGFDWSWARAMLVVEAASLLLFTAYIGLRGFTPEILGTEKPMDVAFLASSARTTVMPPADPWFAGEPINYYYLGYLLQGMVARLAGVAPWVAFNLALATIFSLTIVGAFGIGWNVARPWLGRRAAAASGLLAAFLLAISGNLYAPWRLLQDARATIDAAWWDSAVGIGWRSSRIVCDGPRVGNLCPPPATETINEFPAFSFLLGDLHPHLMALPFTLVAIALAWNLARQCAVATSGIPAGFLARVAATGAVCGALYAMNAWDFPTFLLLIAIGLWAGTRGRPRATVVSGGALLAGAVIPWLPFFLSFVPPTPIRAFPGLLGSLPVLPRLLSAFVIYTDERTSIVEYLTQFGIPYGCAVLLVATGFSGRDGSALAGMRRALLVSAVLTLIPGVLLAAPVIPLCGIPLGAALARLRAERGATPRHFALAAFAAAWALSIGVEVVYIQDAFSSRMNTLFKFYYQTWTLYAVGAAIAVLLFWSAARARSWQRPALGLATLLAVVAASAYPVVASYQWTNHLQGWRGLDGVAYGVATDPGDVAAIEWLATHAQPGDVVLEAAGCAYRPFGRLPFNRISAFTGVPTIIGWGDNHQRQWRAGEPDLLAEIPKRQADVAAIYADPGSPLVARYGIDWMVGGAYEEGDWQADCPTAGPYPHVDDVGFPGAGWKEVFRSGTTRIYQRVAG